MIVFWTSNQGRKQLSLCVCVCVCVWRRGVWRAYVCVCVWVITNLAPGALIVEWAKSNGGKQHSDVEEDGRRHELDQGFVITH